MPNTVTQLPVKANERKTQPRKNYKTNVPEEYWEEILRHHMLGWSVRRIRDRLQIDRNFRASEYTVRNLIDFMAYKKSEEVLDQLKKKVHDDINELHDLYARVKGFLVYAEVTKQPDLFLKCTDRLVNMLQISLKTKEQHITNVIINTNEDAKDKLVQELNAL